MANRSTDYSSVINYKLCAYYRILLGIIIMLVKMFWKIKFRAYLGKRLCIYGEELTSCCDAEIESYFDDDNLWKEYSPKEAVDENLSCWGD